MTPAVGLVNGSSRSTAFSALRPRGSTELILRRHEPGAARRPAPRLGSVLRDRVCTALSWNVFQTLALVAPSFWVRRLRARLFGLDVMDHVPIEAAVAMWERLPQTRDRNAHDPPVVDVLIQTEHAVFGLMTLFEGDLAAPAVSAAGGDGILDLIDGVSARAGIRDGYIGLITSDAADSPLAASLIDRYAASRDRLVRRLPSRRDGLVNVRGIGRATWSEMLAILHDCAGAPVLDDLERYAAARAVRWAEDAGISPAE